MYQKLEECPSCKHTLFTNHLICTDYSISQESFALVRCNKCGLVFTNPRPDEKNILEYYKSDQYISHANKSNSLINVLYKFARSFTLRSKYRLIHKYKKGKRLLDFGCGTGHFANYMSARGWDVTGYDPQMESINNLKIKFIDNIQKISSEDKFHVITAWHVLEHVHDLKGTLKLLRKQLKKGGYLFIAVPNLNSYDAKHYKNYWAAYDVPRHLYHFTQSSFKSLASSCKLSVVKVHPMKLDSFYVSWLSEKYQGNNNVLSAIKTGLKSNRLARSSGEYSSLIYVLKA
ncbi:MAG: class I SAM-dependent methyltransferase [Cyclobacteriaceae bacterium]|nr:class I SAM-dependent methyltransferase [Cyclobacteriaceae bacterium SS2]